MINYSAGFGGFIDYAVMNATGSEFLIIAFILFVVAVFATMAFRIPTELSMAILYSPILVASAYNSQFLKILMMLVFYFSVIAMKLMFK